MTLIQVGVGDYFPIVVVCFPDGTLQLTPIRRVGIMFDQKPGGVSAVFYDDGFTLADNSEDAPMEYEYNYPYQYKQMPLLKQWLVQQQLMNPQG